MTAKQKNPDINLAFDVGHSSIGWAVMQTSDGCAGVSLADQPNILGCGAVIFRADDCLASKRRGYRRQRRHIRSTRQRIRQIKLLLNHLGVLSERELNAVGTAWPWKLAASVLATNGQLTLSWSELWDVLRWYAHNRGYDGNLRWSAAEASMDNISEEELAELAKDASLTDDEKQDAEKVKEAKRIMREIDTRTMAETFCKHLNVDPVGKKSSSTIRFKGLNAAFPREVVEAEVRRILQAHFGKLKGVDAQLERALCGRDNRDKDAWQAIPCPAISLPSRYEGGLLFGQLVPRFDNRIISKCPVTGDKVPSRNCREFLDYRWAMQLANVRVAENGARESRPLTADERRRVDAKMRAAGSMTAKEFSNAIFAVTEATHSNLETMLMHPDAKEALLLDPVQKELTSGYWETLFPKLPERIQKRARGQLRRGRMVSFEKLYEQAVSAGECVAAFDVEIQRLLDTANTKKRKKDRQLSRDFLLSESASVKKLSGRAAYSRSILQKAYEEVMTGKHPKEEGGCLFVSEKMREAQLQREIDDQTNNHLIRHRLRLLERLQRDIIKEYASADKSRISRITIEVNRDLREMSGKNAKEKAQDLGQRVANHHHVAENLKMALKEQTFNGKPIVIGAGLIRKGRIAEDLGWTCPYTGQIYRPIDLVTRRVDKDHIVPRSQRASDSLDSLVITFSSVNKMKGKRTALKFIEDEQGKAVEESPNLSIVNANRYREFVAGLESYRGHNDDKKRKKRRKELLMLRDFEEGEFTPRDLTQTSQLVRLGAQMLKKPFIGEAKQPVVTSMPGSVTDAVRKGMNLLGCLIEACPQVVDENDNVKTKTKIRDITHLHHALDACVLGVTSHFIPNNGAIWNLIVKRNLSGPEKEQLRLGTRGYFNYTREGFRVADLPNPLKQQIRKRLAENRVVQHVPARMSGLPVDLNMWRLRGWNEDGNAILEKHSRDTSTGERKRDKPKRGADKKERLIGWNPMNGEGKLKKLNAVLITNENFGIALDPQPEIIPYHKVWHRLQELKKVNGGNMPRTLRKGQIIIVTEGIFKGVWKVFSAKNNASGIALDIGRPDVVRLQDKVEGHKKNVRLASLIKGGLKIAKIPLTGVACPTTLSASTVRNAR